MKQLEADNWLFNMQMLHKHKGMEIQCTEWSIVNISTIKVGIF